MKKIFLVVLLSFLYLFFSFSFVFSFSIFKGSFKAFQNIEIVDKKLKNDVFLYGLFFSVLKTEDSFSQKKLILSLNLYNVGVIIYKEKKLISIDRYSRYEKEFEYILKDNVLSYANEKDSDPWSFLKVLVILREIDQNFSKITSNEFFIKSENILIFKRDRYGHYLVSEKYKNFILSEGIAKLKENMIYFQYDSYVDKKKVNSQFTIRSKLNAQVIFF